MLTYKAMYKFLDDGVHGEVLDFAGVISCGRDLNDARRMLADAMVDMAETNLSLGDSLPAPDSTLTNPDSDIEEPIYLVFNAASRIRVVPELLHEAA